MMPERSHEVAATIALVSLNEENTIAGALGALIQESDETGSEVIVMAGGKDRTVDIVATMLKDRQGDRLVVDSAPRGKPAALNTILGLANGSVIVLSDGDVEVRHCSVKLLLDVMNSGDYGAASGRVVGMPGKYNAVEKACDLAKRAGARPMRLRVGGAFHSALLEEAAQRFGEVLQDVAIREPRCDLYLNVTGTRQSDPDAIKELLRNQLRLPVRWEKLIRSMLADGYGSFTEIGPGNVLTGLVSRISKEAERKNINSLASLQAG